MKYILKLLNIYIVPRSNAGVCMWPLLMCFAHCLSNVITASNNRLAKTSMNKLTRSM